jgi:hypothetical protein
VEDEGRRAAIARECLADDRVAVRAWTAQVLGTWGVPVAGDVLADLIQSDPHPEVRSKAALNLAQTDGPRLVNCVQEMLEGPPDHQQWALEAIDLIQHAAPEVLNPGQLARFDLRQRLRRLRLRRNRARRSRNTLYAALGGVLGAAIGGTAGAALSLSPSQMPWLPYFALLSILIGLATGIGAGLGFGTVEAMDERRRFPYVTGAALGGGIGCMVVGGIGGLGISTYHILIGAAIGLAGGITSGGGAAVVANLTANIASPARRLAMRLALGLIAGIIPGAVFVLGGHLEAMALKELPYGLGLGMLLTSGIAGGLELAGRGLGPTHQPGESARSSDIEKARIERKGDQI